MVLYISPLHTYLCSIVCFLSFIVCLNLWDIYVGNHLCNVVRGTICIGAYIEDDGIMYIGWVSAGACQCMFGSNSLLDLQVLVE